GYAVRTAVAPVNTAAQIAGRPDRSVLGGLRDQFLDIRNPSPASRKFDAGVVRRYDQQARQREKKGEF
ncbi:hypothetical protein, partial [Escherichia coli]|uniref:hypothetical protein n=1 Tax=Escherichia coli TaxID=562 RepID=UPI0015E5C0D1